MNHQKDVEEGEHTEPMMWRQVELLQAYEANKNAGKAPYEGVTIVMMGELLWLLKRHNWLYEPEKKPRRKEGAQLQGMCLAGANLKNVQLWQANLADANLDNAILDHSWLGRAHLEGASLRYASLLC